jgi:hypothetical protein
MKAAPTVLTLFMPTARTFPLTLPECGTELVKSRAVAQHHWNGVRDVFDAEVGIYFK